MDYTILSRPRISPAGFRAILVRAGSPAASSAASAWASFVHAGVDPAVALAVFRKESTFGRFGRAASNRSWGNIRTSPDYPTRGGFAVYPSWGAGAADAARLLAVYGHSAIRPGVDTSTVRRFPFVWAPTADGNAPAAYGASLAAWITEWARACPPAGVAPPPATYRVRAGDTLAAIAKRYGIRAQGPIPPWRVLYLFAANERVVGADPNLIRPGQVLRLPPR